MGYGPALRFCDPEGVIATKPGMCQALSTPWHWCAPGWVIRVRGSGGRVALALPQELSLVLCSQSR